MLHETCTLNRVHNLRWVNLSGKTSIFSDFHCQEFHSVWYWSTCLLFSGWYLFHLYSGIILFIFGAYFRNLFHLNLFISFTFGTYLIDFHIKKFNITQFTIHWIYFTYRYILAVSSFFKFRTFFIFVRTYFIRVLFHGTYNYY